MEIERKFLLPTVPEGIGGRSRAIRQGYVAVSAETEVRVRDADGSMTLTVKSGSGLARHEAQISISAEQFEALWPTTEGRRVEKRRIDVPLDGLLAEVDVYEGDLAGLLVVEVEFPSRGSAGAFEPPAWFGPEVTDDARYKNAALAVDGAPRS